MQNKGFVKLFAALVSLVCLYYLSFSIVYSYYENKAEKIAGGDVIRYNAYLDSLAGEKVWLGYTLKECHEQELNLGLDLKGGMNVVMEVSVPDILQALAGDKRTNEMFVNTIAEAKKRQLSSQKDFVNLFEESFKSLYPDEKLADMFSSFEMKDKISPNSSNADVVKVLKNEVKSAVDNSFNVLRSRIDRFGVVQPNIQQLEVAGRILIEMPGIKEPERVRKLLQGSADLEFWETMEFSEIYSSIVAANNMVRDIESANTKQEAQETDNTETATVAEVEDSQKSSDSEVDELLAKIAEQDSTAADKDVSQEEFAKNNPLFAILHLNVDQQGRPGNGPIIGTVHVKDTAKVSQYLIMAKEKRILPASLLPKWTVKAIDQGGKYFQLIAIHSKQRDGRAPLSGGVITDARADFGEHSSRAEVSMQMNQEGAKIWARMTKENIGKCIAIVLDGYVYSFPTVNGEIPGGRSQITGHFTPEEAKDLANVLKSGKMPAPARIVQEDVVGPSLGQEAIRNGLISFIAAFILILLYMMFYYGVTPGLVADTALIVNAFFLFGVLASFKAVLTLPGIAGIVLALGMAIDANVLIYERIREELKAGKQIKRALADGYKNALNTIIDANITTVITGVILFVFGTGPIRGFATTLMIGIVCSFFTAVFLTRLIFEHLLKNEKYHDLPFTTNLTKNWLQNTTFNFIGKRNTFYKASAVVVVVIVASLFIQGLKPGIDFSGGRNYIVRFEQPVKTTEIDALMSKSFDGESVSVITIGASNQVRISTNFKIEETSEEIDHEIENRIYEGLKPILNSEVTRSLFANGYRITPEGQAVSIALDQKGESYGIQSSQKVGPTMADDIKKSAVIAVILALLAIGLYIFIRFRDVSFSVGSVVGLSFDAVFIIGLYSLLHKVTPFSLEIDQSFIAAILTVVGYSINDKVVIFDRIRENVGLYPTRDRLSVMNDAMNATMSRTFSTGFSTLLVLVVIFFFGGDVIRGFIFGMMMGIISCVYSSLFISSPIAYNLLKNPKLRMILMVSILVPMISAILWLLFV